MELININQFEDIMKLFLRDIDLDYKFTLKKHALLLKKCYHTSLQLITEGSSGYYSERIECAKCKHQIDNHSHNPSVGVVRQITNDNIMTEIEFKTKYLKKQKIEYPVLEESAQTGYDLSVFLKKYLDEIDKLFKKHYSNKDERIYEMDVFTDDYKRDKVFNEQFSKFLAHLLDKNEHLFKFLIVEIVKHIIDKNISARAKMFKDIDTALNKLFGEIKLNILIINQIKAQIASNNDNKAANWFSQFNRPEQVSEIEEIEKIWYDFKQSQKKLKYMCFRYLTEYRENYYNRQVRNESLHYPDRYLSTCIYSASTFDMSTKYDTLFIYLIDEAILTKYPLYLLNFLFEKEVYLPDIPYKIRKLNTPIYNNNDGESRMINHLYICEPIDITKMAIENISNQNNDIRLIIEYNDLMAKLNHLHTTDNELNNYTNETKDIPHDKENIRKLLDIQGFKFNVSDKGILAEIVIRIHFYIYNYPAQVDTLIKSLFISSETSSLIFKEKNTYTVQKAYYTDKFEISNDTEVIQQINKSFKCYFIELLPPLTFTVPPNSSLKNKSDPYSKEKLASQIESCEIFYTKLKEICSSGNANAGNANARKANASNANASNANARKANASNANAGNANANNANANNAKPINAKPINANARNANARNANARNANAIKKLLYKDFTSKDDLLELVNFFITNLETIRTSFKDILFLSDDGFQSTVNHFKNHAFFNGKFTHRFMDPRHLLTILCGSQSHPNFHSDIKEELLEYINTVTDTKIILLLFTRFKLALYEFYKFNPESKKFLIDYIESTNAPILNAPILNAPINNTLNGGKKEYIKLQSGGKRLIRYGSKGGKYYIKANKKCYIKSIH